MAKRKSQAPHDDRGFILDPRNWPLWPFLPIKRGNNSLEDKNLGVLVSTEDHVKKGKMVVYHCYMFAIGPKNPNLLKECPKTEYENVDALLADGWIVD